MGVRPYRPINPQPQERGLGAAFRFRNALRRPCHLRRADHALALIKARTTNNRCNGRIMAEYELYCFAQSGNAYRVALMLNLIGADWSRALLIFSRRGKRAVRNTARASMKWAKCRCWRMTARSSANRESFSLILPIAPGSFVQKEKTSGWKLCAGSFSTIRNSMGFLGLTAS